MKHHVISLKVINTSNGKVCMSLLTILKDRLVSQQLVLSPLLLLVHPFCSLGKISSRYSYITSAMTPVMSFHITGRQKMGPKLPTVFSLLGFFKHKIVLPNVNHCGNSSSPFKRSFNCSGILQCRLLSFFNQNPCTPFLRRVFQFGIFLLWIVTISAVTSSSLRCLSPMPSPCWLSPMPWS